MNENLLNALIKLFALASTDDDLTTESRGIVESFLRSELNSDQVAQYLELYDKCIIEYHTVKGTNTDTLNDENLSAISAQVNSGLLQKQKFVVLIRLLEYILADGNISKHELDFLKKLSESLNISEDEFCDLLAFSESNPGDIRDNSSLLVVQNSESAATKSLRYLLRSEFDDTILIIHIPSVKLLAFRFFGDESLTLNGQPINPNKTFLFTQGSSVRSSKLDPIYYSDIISVFMDEEKSDRILFEVDQIEFTFPKGNKGLHQLSFAEPSGRLVGIMGGSGAGKSTLLNVLNGNLSPSKGQVTINGIDIHKQKEQIKGVIGYVTQDDLLIEDLSVYQNLYYNARLCFADKTEGDIKRLVLDLLETLGLHEARDLKVGNPVEKVISGGQRKRLNIALELIREPSILFVDEPTSGLSSRDSENIMDLLKQLALKGKLIFVVIHQPSSDIFKMFDKLLMLDVGGYPVYYGDPVDAVVYFKTEINHINCNESECNVCGNVNPEQIFTILEAKVLDEYGNLTNQRRINPSEWNERYLKNTGQFEGHSDKVDEEPSNNLSTPRWLGQWKIFTIRDVLSKWSNKQYMLINFLEAPVLAFILSFFIKYASTTEDGSQVYKLINNENLPAYLFMAVVVSLFIGLTVSAEEIIRDRKIRKREKFLELSKGAYLSSKIMILFIISAIQTITFIWIGNYIMEIEGMTWSYFVILFSTACFANMLGLNISSAFNKAVTIYILIPFLIIPQLIFSGVIVKFDKLNPDVSSQSHVPLIGEVMASRWAFEALAVEQFKNNPCTKLTYPYDKAISVSNYFKVYWVPEVQSRINLIEQDLHGDGISTPEEIERTKDLIYNEMSKRHPGVDFPPYPFKESADERFVESELERMHRYLDDLQRGLVKYNRQMMGHRDDIVYSLNNDSSVEDYYNILKAKHTNTALEDMLTNKSSLEKILVVKSNFVQQADPIYRDATSLRAHFYAPQKAAFGKMWDTKNVNVIVIWLMSILLGVTLYFDTFRWLISKLSKINSKP